MSIQVLFGVGNLILTRTDVANSTPVKFGVLQECQIDFDFTNKELIGQSQFPVDVARAQGKITGKAKVANILARGINDSFFGGTLTSGTAGILFANNEAHTVSSTTQAVTNAATFVADQGVYYASTGLPLTLVASGPTTGQYSVNTSTGVYTFAVADEVALLFNYTYTVSTGASEIAISNQLMGTSPVFSMLLATTYKGNVFNLQLPAAISTKLSFPFKNVDYAINDFEFQAYANAAGSIATITMTQ